MEYEVIIGLEIHVQLKTKSKMFCSCPNNSDAKEPNINICPVCLGHPGTLPVPNQEAIRWTVKTGLALHCQIPKHSKFDRKNYFYPDLPKGYQISQLDEPLCQGGYLEVKNGEKISKVQLERIHLEEDAGKLIHPEGVNYSLVDFNRAGTPLMEIVTKPDIKSPAQARLFLQELRKILRYLEVSDADMEKGHLRCDANISLREKGATKKNPKTEIKNMNSFRSVERALNYEIERQRELWESGEGIKIETTRSFREEQGITEEMRSKEEAADYRYFPEPDIPPVKLTEPEIAEIKTEVPELPTDKIGRFRDEYFISEKEAIALTEEKETANYFEQVMTELEEWVRSLATEKKIGSAEKKELNKLALNWILSKLFKHLREDGLSITQLKITPENFAELIAMIYEQKINSSAAQIVLAELYKRGGDPSQIVEEKNLAQVSGENELQAVVDKVIKENPEAIADYKKGKKNAVQFLVGRIMAETKGKANPGVARKVIEETLKKS